MNIISYARKGRNHDVHSSISDGAAGGHLLNPVSVHEAMKDVDNRRVWEYCCCAPVRILSPSPFWKDLASTDWLTTSESYLEASAFYSNSGMLLGEPSLQVFEVKGGFLDPEVTVQANGS
jgi:hypothetical protein